MTEWQLEKILDVCRESAKIALSFYHNPPMELKADNSVVTAADKAIEDYLTSALIENNDSFLIGEETIGKHDEEYVQAALTAKACWIVDPIDGTAPYSCQFPAWGHTIALMEHGKITNGVLYLPVQDELIITDNQDVWLYHNLLSENPTREKFTPQQTGIDIRRPVAVAQRYAKGHAIEFENQVFCWSACVAACYYLLQGKLMSYLAVVKLWDIAGFIAIMERVGYVGVNEFGKQLGNLVNSENYKLDIDDPDRWRLRGATALAANNEIANYILKSVERKVGE